MKSEIISTTPIGSEELPVADAGSESERASLLVSTSQHGARLDKCLAELLPAFSRSYLQHLMLQGDVTYRGQKVIKPSTKVHAGESIDVLLRQTDQARSFTAEALSLNIVYEDDSLLVLNKQAGMVVHPAAGNWSGTVMNGLLYHHSGAADLPRAGIVHRLDKDTSGLMVVAKTRIVMEALVRLIAQRAVNRLYLAIVEKPWNKRGVWTVADSIGRDPINRLRMAVLPSGASGSKIARTQFRALASRDALTLVACKLFTGRTHQIRVHLAHNGYPILGDQVYGGRIDHGMHRQALHATRLEFEHPVNGQRLSFLAPLPDDMGAALSIHGLNYNPASLGAHTFADSDA